MKVRGLKLTSVVRLSVLGVVLVGFLLRVFRLDFQSLWWDETYSVYMARQTLGDITFGLWFDQVPLFYYSLWALVHLAGHSEFAVRYLSVACGVLTIPLLYQFIRLSGRTWAAVAGSGLLAVSAFHIYYSQETRMHALAALLGLASGYLLVRASRKPELWRWALYAVAGTAALYTFYYIAPVLLALNLPVLLDSRLRNRRWLAANGSIALAVTPWLAMAYPRFQRYLPQRAEGSAALDLFHYLEHTMESLVFGATKNETLNSMPPAYAAIALAVLALTLVAAWQLLRRGTMWDRIAVSYALLPLLCLYFLTHSVPVFATRYALAALPAMAAVLVAAFAPIFRRISAAGWLTVAVVALITVPGLVNNYADPNYARDDYRQAFAVIRSQSLPDEVVVYDTAFQYTALAQYYPDGPLATFGLPVNVGATVNPARLLGLDSPGDKAATEAKLGQLATQNSGVWAVYFGEGSPWVENWLDTHMTRVSNTWYGVSMRLAHYRRSPGPSSDELPGGTRVAEQFGPLLLQQLATSVEEQRLLVWALWTPSGQTSVDYNVSFQLFDRNDQREAQWDGPPSPAAVTSRWSPATSYQTAVAIPLSHPLVSGIYELKVSVYDSAGHVVGQQRTAALLDIGATVEHLPLEVSAGGWTLASANVRGDSAGGLLVSIRGSVQATTSVNYTWFAHLLDAQGEVVSQDDRPPISPTSAWRPGDSIVEVFRLSPVAGGASIEFGAYDSTGTRAVFRTSSGPPVDQVSLPLEGKRDVPG